MATTYPPLIYDFPAYTQPRPDNIMVKSNSVSQYTSNDYIGYRRELERLKAAYLDNMNPQKWSLQNKKMALGNGVTYIPTQQKYRDFLGFPSDSQTYLDYRTSHFVDDSARRYPLTNPQISSAERQPITRKRPNFDIQYTDRAILDDVVTAKHHSLEKDHVSPFNRFMERFMQMYPPKINETKEEYNDRVVQTGVYLFKSQPESFWSVADISRQIYQVVVQKTARETDPDKVLYDMVDDIRNKKIKTQNLDNEREEEQYDEIQNARAESTPQTEKDIAFGVVNKTIEMKAAQSDLLLKEKLMKDNPEAKTENMNELLMIDKIRKDRLEGKQDVDIKTSLISKFPEILQKFRAENPKLNNSDLIKKIYEEPLDSFIEISKTIPKYSVSSADVERKIRSMFLSENPNIVEEIMKKKPSMSKPQLIESLLDEASDEALFPPEELKKITSKEITELKQLKEKLEMDNRNMKLYLHRKNQELEEKESQNISLEEQLKKTEYSYTFTSDTLRELSNELIAANNQLYDLEQNQPENDVEIGELEDKINTLTKKKKTATKMIKELKFKTQHLEEEKEQYQKTVDELVDDYEKKTDELRNNKEALVDAQEALLQYQQYFDDIFEKYKKETERSEQLETTNLELISKNKDLNDKIKQIDDENKKYQNESSQLQTEILGLKNKIEKDQKQLTEFRQKYEETRKNVEELTQKYNSSQNTSDRFLIEEQLVDSQEKLKKLDFELKKKESIIAKQSDYYDSQIEEKENKLKKLETTIDSLQKEKSSAVNQLATKHHETTMLRSTLQSNDLLRLYENFNNYINVELKAGLKTTNYLTKNNDFMNDIRKSYFEFISNPSNQTIQDISNIVDKLKEIETNPSKYISIDRDAKGRKVDSTILNGRKNALKTLVIPRFLTFYNDILNKVTLEKGDNEKRIQLINKIKNFNSLKSQPEPEPEVEPEVEQEVPSSQTSKKTSKTPFELTKEEENIVKKQMKRGEKKIEINEPKIEPGIYTVDLTGKSASEKQALSDAQMEEDKKTYDELMKTIDNKIIIPFSVERKDNDYPELITFKANTMAMFNKFEPTYSQKLPKIFDNYSPVLIKVEETRETIPAFTPTNAPSEDKIDDIVKKFKDDPNWKVKNGTNEQKGDQLFFIPKDINLVKDLRLVPKIQMERTSGHGLTKRKKETSTKKGITAPTGRYCNATISHKRDLSQYGYKDVINLSSRQRHAALQKALDGFYSKPGGHTSLLRKLHALAIVQRKRNPELSKIFDDDASFVSKIHVDE